ncbi:winged helix-turn-helix transcriptional regulator [Massilia antarctica]|uniref:Winged helix-turn-helix transcriptional regulator n=2 Tax=Massilia antarctica TaxID=2765360 RepID=A0AA49ACQ8_9BURK|nr:winged helix-turn-helix transcriptional regulator [Massilia antarctica]
MAAVGLKTTQYSVLANVARKALPVAELAERLGMERTTLTRNLKPLMEAGWVVQRPGADSRQRIVTITEAGQQKLAESYPVWCGAQRAFEQLVGPGAVHALHTQLDSTLAQLTPLIEDLPHAHPE